MKCLCHVCNKRKTATERKLVKEISLRRRRRKKVKVKFVCTSCRLKEHRANSKKHEECSCGKIGPVAARDEKGGAICGRCYEKNYRHDSSTHEKCSVCKNSRPVHTRTKNGQPVCHTCWQRERNAERADELAQVS